MNFIVFRIFLFGTYLNVKQKQKLANKIKIRELEELRTYLNVKQKQKLANKIKIRELRKTITATLCVS